MNTTNKEILSYLILKDSEIIQEFENDLWIKVNKEDYFTVTQFEVCKLCQDYTKIDGIITNISQEN